MKKLLFLSLIASLLFSGCAFSPCGFSKDHFVGNHEKLVKAAKKNKKSWSETEWEAKDEQMKRMVEECYENYEDEMNSDEVAEFWAGTGAYYYNRFGRGFLRELKRSEKDVTRALEKGLKSLEENKEGFVKDWFKENVGEDLKGALDDVKGELEKLGDELQDWLEE